MTAFENNIISLLQKDPLIDDKTIGKILNRSTGEVTKRIEQLADSGAIKIGEINQAGMPVRKIFVYSATKKKVTETDLKGKEIRYSYELAPGFKNKIIEGTRYFCEKMVKSKKLYSRAEIDQISKVIGHNVWEMRGGWYRKPGTDISVPKCRHIWMSHIVKRK